ncbi:MAG: trehalose-phosphatase [Sphingomonas sp.]
MAPSIVTPPAPTDEAPPTRVAGVSLFFDFDGTLVDLAPTPDAVVVDAALLDVLARHAARAPGRVAIVSGRSIAQLDSLLGAFAGMIAVAGSHGADLRVPGVRYAPAGRPPVLDKAIAAIDAFASPRGLLVERKSHGVALHFRRTPAAAADAITAMETIAARTGLFLQHGKMMVELRAPGDKGRAIEALLTTPAMAGTTPLFFGDDVTDEDGFAAAAAAGGAGVLVGEARGTAALYRLPNVAALHAWMATTLETAA